jgi:hypothetical protein
MRDAALSTLVAAFALAACALFGAKPFESDAEYKAYVSGLQLSGVISQAAMTRAEDEGFECRVVDHVIQTAPQELVLVCQRSGASLSCSQSQSIVLRLDWIGTPSPKAAPGMRVGTVGSVLGKKECG